MQKFFYGKRWLFIFLLQGALIAAAFLFSFLLRFDFSLPNPYRETFFELLPSLILIKITVFWTMGLGQGWWRYVSLADVFPIFRANLVASTCFVLFVVFAYGMRDVPRSALILDGIFCFLLISGVRFLTRAFRERYFSFRPSAGFRRLLIVGAGRAGQAIVRETRQNSSLKLTAVGFADDDVSKYRRRFQGVSVLGNCADLAKIVEKHGIEEIIIAIPSASGAILRPIVESCLKTGVPFKTLPGVGDLIDEKIYVHQARKVAVEDLLGRDPVNLDFDKIRAFLQGKKILVTGAGGSIGSEISRQVVRFDPSLLVILDNSESSLFQIEQELLERNPAFELVSVVGDIRNRARIEGTFEEFTPDVVFHAAAYKHVPMLESNPAEAADNNIRGTKIVADAARKYGSEGFVMISTDKAVNPANIMGATKRAAEIYVQNLARESRTRFVTVRFGNVLGSAGSVIPVFMGQIEKGGPVKVTHPEIERFFMTIPEAVQLVLQAASMGRGGEIFLLEMGAPVKIRHLAEELIRLSGFRPYEDIDIVYTGLRPGEKLYEELFSGDEGIVETEHQKILIAESVFRDLTILNRHLEELYQLTRTYDAREVVVKLQEIVPEFNYVHILGENGPVYLNAGVKVGIS